MTSKKLTDAISYTLQDTIILNAQRLASQILTANGAAHCAGIISELLEGYSTTDMGSIIASNTF